MSGSTDAPFRRQVVRYGARAVVSEMVAGDALVASRPDVIRRICRHEGQGAWIVQLTARRPEDMRAGAETIRRAGVDVIDINMGCPSRQVTGGNSGSALMREPDLAIRIIEAALEGADGTPVTLKMRLGWDHSSLNAAEIAMRAEALGVKLITVHGRTRCQFYKGVADWGAIRATVDSVAVPVIANGDIHSLTDVRQALSASTANGVMIGRAAMGRPWLLAEIDAALRGVTFTPPSMLEQCEHLCEQIEDSLSLYGTALGLRIVRKHVSASIEKLDLTIPEESRRRLRAKLCRMNNVDDLQCQLRHVYIHSHFEIAA